METRRGIVTLSIRKDFFLPGLTIAAGIALLAGFLLENVYQLSEYAYQPLYYICYIFGSYTFMVKIYKSFQGFKPDIDLLMFIAAIGAAIIGKWSEGGLLLFLFGLGNTLEDYAMRMANKSLSRLTKLMPKMAFVKNNGEIKEVPVENLKVGDIIVVKPNSAINADGVVIAGTSNVNESAITGESIPVEKFAPSKVPKAKNLHEIPSAHRVFSGTLNDNGFLEVKVLREACDSTLSKLIQLVHAAQKQKAHVQKFTEKFELIFVPAVLIFVFLLNFTFLVLDESFSQSFYRAITVLVVSSPCALVISAPSTVLSGVARAAKCGVLIKGGKPLEDLGIVTGVAFDKTGTLTKADPRVTDFLACNGVSEGYIKQMAVAVEEKSDHVLARAIVRDLKSDSIKDDLFKVSHFTSLTGRGVKAILNNEEVVIGGKKAIEEFNNIVIPGDIYREVQNFENEGKTTILISKSGIIVGVIAIMDLPRQESAKIVGQLHKMGIKKVVMLTGDNQKVATSIGNVIGITEVAADLMPSDKVSAIQRLLNQNVKVAMVGDGVNDAPALASSTVGISMGAAGSDVAMETADVALMSDKLDYLPFTIALGRMARKVIKQNIFISLGVIVVMIPVTLLGMAHIGLAVLIHEGSTVLVAFNAMRLLGFKYRPNQETPAISPLTLSRKLKLYF